MRIALAALLVACSSPGPEASICEHAREQALENQKYYIAEVLLDTPEAKRAEIQQQADRETANLAANFVPACRKAGDFKPECFASPESEHSPECRSFVRTFTGKISR